MCFQGDHPTALSVLDAGINGQKGFGEENVCTTCGEPKAKKQCSACKMVCHVFLFKF